MVGGGDPFYVKFWVDRPPVGVKSLILNQSAIAELLINVRAPEFPSKSLPQP